MAIRGCLAINRQHPIYIAHPHAPNRLLRHRHQTANDEKERRDA